MDLMVNPVITDFQQDVNGDIKMLKLGANKEDAWTNIAEQGGSAKLDNNKAATIDVSTYTEPVVINPTSGKDGMKKATITLSNIPSTNSVTFYAWLSEGSGIVYTITENPEVGDNVYIDDSTNDAIKYTDSNSIVSVGEGTITLEDSLHETTIYSRDSESDKVFTKN